VGADSFFVVPPVHMWYIFSCVGCFPPSRPFLEGFKEVFDKAEVTYGGAYPCSFFPGGACYVRTVVREKLRKYLSEHGKDVLQEPEGLRLYLLREEGRFPQEIDGLLRLVEEGLLPPFPAENERDVFLQRIVRELEVSPEDALWFLESWEGVRDLLEAPRTPSESSSGNFPENSSEDLASFRMFLANPGAFVPRKLPQVAPAMVSFLRDASPEKKHEVFQASVPEDASSSELVPETAGPETEQPLVSETPSLGYSPEEPPREDRKIEDPLAEADADFSEQPVSPLSEELPEEDVSSAEISPLPEDEKTQNPLSEKSELAEAERLPREEPSGETEKDTLFAGVDPGDPEKETAQETTPRNSWFPEASSTEEALLEDASPQPGEVLGETEEPAAFREPLKPETPEDLFGQEDPNPEYVGVRETRILLDDSQRRKRLFRLALAGICGVVAAGAVGYSMWRNTPERLLDRGRSRLEKKDYPGAALLFRKALHKDEDHPEGYQLLGEALYQQGEYPEALNAFEESLRRVSGDAFLYNNIAYAQLALGNLEEASATFQETLRLVPLYPQARKGLALTYFEQGKLDLAKEELQSALESIPEDGEMLLALGQIHAQSGSLERAEALLTRVLDLEPDNESARIEMEEILREKTLREAQEASRAARLSEYIHAGETFLLSGEILSAEEMYRKALEEEPRSLEARGGLLDSLLMQHRSEDARLLVAEVRSMEKADAFAEDFVQYLVQTLDSYEKAARERAARHEAYEMAIARASEMRKKKQFEGALAAYRGILEEEEYPPAYIGLGRTLERQAKYEEALEAYERALVLLSSSGTEEVPEDLLQEIHDLRESLARQELAKELEPLYRRARTLENQGKAGEARKLYEAILQKDPSHRNARGGLARLSRKPEQVSPSPSKDSPGGENASPAEPPAWLLLPDGQPALMEMHRQEELRNLRKSTPQEMGTPSSVSAKGEYVPGEIPVLVEDLFLQGDILARKGLYKDAETLYRRALEKAPLRGDIRHNLAWVLGMQKRNRSALKEFRQALLQMGPNPVTLYNLAYLYSREKDSLRAFRALEQALYAEEGKGGYRLFRFPDMDSPLLPEAPPLPLGEEQAPQDFRGSLSLEILGKAKERNPGEKHLYDAFFSLGFFQERQGLSPKNSVEECFRSRSFEGRSYTLLGHAFHARGRYEEAQNALERALAKDPGNGIAYALLARTARARGNEQMAMRAVLLARMCRA